MKKVFIASALMLTGSSSFSCSCIISFSSMITISLLFLTLHYDYGGCSPALIRRAQ